MSAEPDAILVICAGEESRGQGVFREVGRWTSKIASKRKAITLGIRLGMELWRAGWRGSVERSTTGLWDCELGCWKMVVEEEKWNHWEGKTFRWRRWFTPCWAC